MKKNNFYISKLSLTLISTFCFYISFQFITYSNSNISYSEQINTEIINKDSRVLHIGDSHTAGFYGKEIDRLLRLTGANVRTYGSSGSSPNSWLNGYITKSGFFYKDENENSKIPDDWKIISLEFDLELKKGTKKDWQIPTKTPNIKDIIGEFNPNIVIFSLGANMIYSSNSDIENQVKEICEIAKSYKCRIIWVGPPNGRSDKKTPEQQERLYSHIQKIVLEYGTFIDSRPYTYYPDSWTAPRFDGVHFLGDEGKSLSKDWANRVFQKIQNIKD